MLLCFSKCQKHKFQKLPKGNAQGDSPLDLNDVHYEKLRG